MKQKHSPLEEVEMQLMLADKISRLAIHTSSAREIAQHTVAELMELVPIDWASLALIDGTARQAQLIPLVDQGDLGEERVIPLDGTYVGWVAEKRQALLEPFLRRERWFTATLGERIRTAVHMPLIYQGEVFGVLSAGSSLPNAYGKSQLRFLRHAAAHLAVALKSALLLEQNLRVEASLTNLSQLLGIITSNPELPETFPALAAALRKVVPFDRLSLAHIEGSILRVLAVFGEKESYPKVGEVCLLRDSAVPWMQEHEGIDVEADFSLQRRFPIDDLHLQEGFRGEIRVPLFSHGNLLATLHLVSREPYHLKDELAFLAQLAQYLATPVESYILYRLEKQRLDWLGALVHNLGTPLTPIVSSSQLLAEELRQEGNSTHARLARNILLAAQGLKKNLKLFQDFSQVESTVLSLKMEIVDPKPILSQAIDEAFPAAEAKSQLLALEVPETLPQVSVDLLKIKQVLGILLGSSINHSPEGSRIELKARTEGEALVVEVVNTVACWSPEQRERLLRPYRLSEADRTYLPELTLSLAICRRLVELHGGRLWLGGEPGKGNIFGFSLPKQGRSLHAEAAVGRSL